jgi:molybdopterin/thiamine biosynthesis adenylyltransferase
MRYSVTFLEHDHKLLVAHLFAHAVDERAAFLLGRPIKGANTSSILIRKIIPVLKEDILHATATSMAIRSSAYLKVLKEADQTGQCFLFVHSHPSGLSEFSSKDNEEEAALFKTAYLRIHHAGPHASLVYTSKNKAFGRFWFSDGSTQPIELIKVIGKRFQFIFTDTKCGVGFEVFDRQTRALTREFQPVLKQLHVGVVGFGGTGSPVCEQLIRLGVGKLLVIDNGTFEKSNVSRVYGSTVFDEKLPKVNIAARLSASIGLHTDVTTIEKHLSFRSASEALRDCDVVFGCTDDEWGRSILNRLAFWYYVPVFDMGVQIDKDGETILSIQGRVTTLFPTSACLLCRSRISSDRVRAESMAAFDPEGAARLQKEGYLVDIAEPAPSVITFTTGLAAMAVSEFLHRLTGFQGPERESTEVIYFFDQSRIRTNTRVSRPDCFCSNQTKWGLGDQKRFLDLNWRRE